MIAHTVHRRTAGAGVSLHDDRGFTLIELIIYMFLMVVVLALVGGMLINSTGTGKSVGDSADSSNLAQIIAASVRTGVESSSGFKVSGSLSESLLVARTASSGTTAGWTCQAWYFAGNSVYTTRTTPAAAIVAPTASTLPTWTKLADGVSRTGTSAIFAPSLSTLILTFQVASGGATPVLIQTSTLRPDTPLVGSPCFS